LTVLKIEERHVLRQNMKKCEMIEIFFSHWPTTMWKLFNKEKEQKKMMMALRCIVD
jgi:hypothetical protein